MKLDEEVVMLAKEMVEQRFKEALNKPSINGKVDAITKLHLALAMATAVILHSCGMDADPEFFEKQNKFTQDVVKFLEGGLDINSSGKMRSNTDSDPWG